MRPPSPLPGGDTALAESNRWLHIFATEPARADESIRQLQQHLNPILRRFIRRELHLPAIDMSERYGSRLDYLRQESEAALDAFWSLFTIHLCRRRREGRTVAITAEEYLHDWVIRVLRWRSLAPIAALNAALFHYRQAILSEQDRLQAPIRRALEHCCQDVWRRTRGAAGPLADEEDRRCRDVAGRLLTCFVAGSIWQTALPQGQPASAYQAEALDPAELLDLREQSARQSPVQYVDGERFRDIALPLLQGAPGPLVRPDHEHPAQRGLLAELARINDGSTQHLLRNRINDLCRRLLSNPPAARAATALRRLVVLLFLPYHGPGENDFCNYFTTNGLTIRDPDKSDDKYWWAEQLIRSLSLQLEGTYEHQLINALRRQDHFSRMIARLVEYTWLACCPATINQLASNPGAACGVLPQFWEMATGSRDALSSTIFFAATNNHRPEGVTPYEHVNDPEGLLLDCRGGSR